MRLITLLTLLAFGCATARHPQPAVPGGAQPARQRIALAEPDLELWMEGTRPIDPRESASALEESREALSRALEGRGLDGVSDPEQLLVVHAREIARTGERKSAQVWSAVGIVLVVVGIVITAVVLSRSKSSPGRSSANQRTGSIGPHMAPVGRTTRFAPRPYVPPPPIGVALGLDIVVPVAAAAPAAVSVPYADPVESRLASRGWFDGDEVELALELVDAASGAVSWQRTVRADVDPRDAKAVSALFERAVAGLPLGRNPAALEPPSGLPRASPDGSSAGPLTQPEDLQNR